MHIVIDARLYKETGVGRYIRSLLRYLPLFDKDNKYSLLILPSDLEKVKIQFPQFNLISTPAHWHTFKEQIVIPLILNKLNPDLVHFPYFNAPLIYKKNFIASIHDLTLLKMPTGKASTHLPPFYFIKRQGFLLSLKHALYDSKKIITVSYSVKEEILSKFNIPPEKIEVTYESGEIDEDSSEEKIQSINLPKKYLLYVGNAHPHKNLEKLIDAFKIVLFQIPDLMLILIGEEGYFYQRIKKYIHQLKLEKNIILTGAIPNFLLKVYYPNAQALIFPSLSEGFGLPGLEAMVFHCPVLASDIPTFREIYQDAALYFNPIKAQDIAQKILKILNYPQLKIKLIEKGKQRSANFSWTKMVKETIHIYQNVLKT